MLIVVEDVDGCCPVAGLGDSVVVLSVNALGDVAVDVACASVVTVAVGVVPVDTTTTVDRTSGVLAVEELVVLVIIVGGDAVRYGSVTSMYPGLVVTAVDVVGTSMVVAELVDDVTVALFLDGVAVDACSDASSEITTLPEILSVSLES